MIYTAIDLFSGVGGLHIGFEKAGFVIKLCIDNDSIVERTHRRNFPHIPIINRDITTVTPDEIRSYLPGGSVDVVIGGPPCQGFSSIGKRVSSDPEKRRKHDPRNELVLTYTKLIRELRPKFIVMENVKGILTLEGGSYLKNVLFQLHDAGYKAQYKLINMADYGVPEIRERVIIIGNRVGLPVEFPKPDHSDNPSDNLPMWNNCWDAIKDLEYVEDMPEFNHVALKHTQKNIERYKLIPEGGRLPEGVLPPELYRKNFGNTFKRLSRTRPALTMVPGNDAFPIHPTLHRSLTVREAARIQTFPDTIIFEGNRRQQGHQVGNAVPPLFSEKLALFIKNLINDVDQPTKPNAIDLFSGAGGLSIALQNSGFNLLLANEINPVFAETHSYNFPNVPIIVKDINRITKEDIVNVLGNRTVDIIVGGPPCQGFSIFGNRRFINTKEYNPHNDPRNSLVYQFVRIVDILKPCFFLMENVKGFMNLDSGLFVDRVKEQFKSMGYNNIWCEIVCAADYGVPQVRHRMFMIGNRLGIQFVKPEPTHSPTKSIFKPSYLTVGDTIMDLVGQENQVPNHIPMSHNSIVSQRYSYIEEGQKLNPDILPKELARSTRRDSKTGKVNNYSHVYKRLDRNKPSTTMVPGHNAFPIHPTLNRTLTPREAARIQTFPDSHVFFGNRQEQCIQVGNAVPPKMAEPFLKQIAWYLKERTK